MTIALVLFIFYIIGFTVYALNPELGWTLTWGFLLVPLAFLIFVSVFLGAESPLFSGGILALLIGVSLCLCFWLAGAYIRATTPPPDYMHRHGGLWHEHRVNFDLPHVHPEGLDGPFAYVDDQGVDQQQEH